MNSGKTLFASQLHSSLNRWSRDKSNRNWSQNLVQAAISIQHQYKISVPPEVLPKAKNGGNWLLARSHAQITQNRSQNVVYSQYMVLLYIIRITNANSPRSKNQNSGNMLLAGNYVQITLNRSHNLVYSQYTTIHNTRVTTAHCKPSQKQKSKWREYMLLLAGSELRPMNADTKRRTDLQAKFRPGKITRQHTALVLDPEGVYCLRQSRTVNCFWTFAQQRHNHSETSPMP